MEEKKSLEKKEIERNRKKLLISSVANISMITVLTLIRPPECRPVPVCGPLEIGPCKAWASVQGFICTCVGGRLHMQNDPLPPYRHHHLCCQSVEQEECTAAALGLQ